MLRNQYPVPCIHCQRRVEKYAGALFQPGASNTVVCLDCLYNFYGEQCGFFAPVAGATSLFQGLVNPRIRDTQIDD